MVMDSVILEMEGNLKNFNAVKCTVLSRLLIDKVITEEQAMQYSEKWNVIMVKPSWFEQWKRKFSKENDNYIFKYVKFED